MSQQLTRQTCELFRHVLERMDANGQHNATCKEFAPVAEHRVEMRTSVLQQRKCLMLDIGHESPLKLVAIGDEGFDRYRYQRIVVGQAPLLAVSLEGEACVRI